MSNRVKHDMEVVLSDLHIPFQDAQAVELALAFIRRERPGVIHLLGDIADCYAVSRYDRDPERKDNFQDELDAVEAFLIRLRGIAPAAEIIYSEGNHENRLQRFLWNQAPPLAALRSLRLPTILRLAEHGIRYHDSRHPYKRGHLLFTHGEIVRKHSAYTAKANYDRFGCSVICGHTHRQGSYLHRTWEADYGSWENGCLCQLKPEYLVNPDWQQGFSVVWRHGKRFSVEQILITDGSYVYHGKQHGESPRSGSTPAPARPRRVSRARPARSAADRPARGRGAGSRPKAALRHPHRPKAARRLRRVGAAA